MTRIPNTNTVVSYAYEVTVAGKVVGTLQGFTPSANRALERVREIAFDGAGNRDTVEIVPGRSEFSISIDKLEVYGDALFESLDKDLDITQHTDPFTITEILRDSVGAQKTIQYVDCWIQSYSKTVREGTITVAETVTLQATRIVASPLS